MAGKRLGIGVIGAGRWAGWAHLPGWARDERCQIVGVCDIDPERAAAAAAKYGAPVATGDYTELLARDDIDIIDVVTRDSEGILGTANIARAQFLPGLREAGGTAAAVAGRDAARAQKYAADNGIERGVGGYQILIDDPAIDALYIPLPNSLHAEWTLRALAAGKPVLCEKPLCGNVGDAGRVLAAARQTGTLLWEAFVFPFHEQMARITELVDGGAIGELMEIKSNFHFQLGNPGNIRYSRRLEGGALNDVGC